MVVFLRSLTDWSVINNQHKTGPSALSIRQIGVSSQKAAMKYFHRIGTLLVAISMSLPASAQVLLSGIWTALQHEDQLERGPGPELGDYLGLPVNDAARLRAESWDPSRLTLQEHQCRVHIVSYIYRGPLNLRIWEEKDPETQQVIAINNYISTYEQSRTIWMDGRPPPSTN